MYTLDCNTGTVKLCETKKVFLKYMTYLDTFVAENDFIWFITQPDGKYRIAEVVGIYTFVGWNTLPIWANITGDVDPEFTVVMTKQCVPITRGESADLTTYGEGEWARMLTTETIIPVRPHWIIQKLFVAHDHVSHDDVLDGEMVRNMWIDTANYRYYYMALLEHRKNRHEYTLPCGLPHVCKEHGLFLCKPCWVNRRAVRLVAYCNRNNDIYECPDHGIVCRNCPNELAQRPEAMYDDIGLITYKNIIARNNTDPYLTITEDDDTDTEDDADGDIDGDSDFIDNNSNNTSNARDEDGDSVMTEDRKENDEHSKDDDPLRLPARGSTGGGIGDENQQHPIRVRVAGMPQGVIDRFLILTKLESLFD